MLLTGINCPYFLHFSSFWDQIWYRSCPQKFMGMIISFVKTGTVQTSPIVISDVLSRGCLPVCSYCTTKWIQWSSYHSKYF